MIVTHKIKMDLTRREKTPCIDVVQDDKYSRNIQIRLQSNGQDFVLPEGCTALIRYRKHDGTGGVYDTMPDGTQAWMIQGNGLTVRVAPQVCTVPGDVTVTVTLIRGDAVLNCFALCLRVQEVKHGKMTNKPYVNIAGFLPQPSTAKVGQFLRVAAVDENGKVVEIETVKVSESYSKEELVAAVIEALPNAEEVSF